MRSWSEFIVNSSNIKEHRHTSHLASLRVIEETRDTLPRSEKTENIWDWADSGLCLFWDFFIVVVIIIDVF